MLNIIDLFSGAGGLTEGFRTPKFNLIAHVELDKDACKTLQLRDAYYYLKNNNKINKYRDYITKKLTFEGLMHEIPSEIKEKVINTAINKENLQSIFEQINSKRNGKKIEGIIGGPPCQAYSTIGRAQNKRIKDKDERIYLYKYYIEFLKEYQPDFFIFENVKGLLSFKDINGENLLEQITKDFTNAYRKDTYDVKVKVVNCAQYGVPQQRERILIFGQKKSKKNMDFFELLSKKKESPPIIKELFFDLPRLKAGEEKNTYRRVSPCDYIRKNIRTTNLPLTQNISRPNNENDLKIYQIVAREKQKNKNVKYSDLPKSLITHKKSNIFLDRFKAIDGDGISQTVVAHISKDGHYYIHPDVKQNRSITVREAARIQTFPDDFYFESSRTSAFKQIGNAVPPYFSKKISSVIIELMQHK